MKLIEYEDKHINGIWIEELIIPSSIHGLKFYKSLGYDFYENNKNERVNIF